MYTIRVRNGFIRNGEGQRVHLWSYNRRLREDLVSALKNEQDVQMTAMGRDAVYNLIRSMGEASAMLAQEGLSLYADEFQYVQDERETEDGRKIRRQTVTVNLHLTSLTA